MKVLFINNDGGGFADFVEVRDGCTIDEFFNDRLKGAHSSDYLIRINRQPAASSQVLQEGDRISCTPVKIHGAVVHVSANM